MIAAEELGVKYEDIDIKRVDSAYTPVDPGSYGSRVTILAGQATQLAARDAKGQLLEALGKVWGVNADEIEVRNGTASLKANPDKRMSFEKLAKIACYEGSGSVILGKGHSSYGLGQIDFNAGTGNGGTSYSFTAQSVRLGVDMETGKIDVTDFTLAHDAGVALHPISVESQIEGGAIQGMSQAVYEEFIMEAGKTHNSTLVDYKMPRSTDIPDIKVINIITNDPDGPFGAKEASEGSIVSTPPAVFEALHDATGIWFKEQPVTPEKIVKALKEAGKWLK
jgi:CO/xanthine dehydrogenase Mo-binding subunit